MAHNEKEDPIEITGDNNTNMVIELPYFFQEIREHPDSTPEGETPTYRICAQVPAQITPPLPHLHVLETPLVIEQFRSKLVRVVLEGLTAEATHGNRASFKPGGTPWKIKIFFEHF